MSTSSIIVNLIRFIALFLMQVLIFQSMSRGFSTPGFNYVNILVYPVFIMLLPINLPTAMAVGISFVFGLTIDWFYNSLGVHAGACVFMAYLRPLLLGLVEPRGGYPLSGGPTLNALGLNWFVQFSAIFMALHLFIYFSIQFFSFVYIIDILFSTVVSFLVSMIFIIIYQFLLNPKE